MSSDFSRRGGTLTPTQDPKELSMSGDSRDPVSIGEVLPDVLAEIAVRRDAR